MQATNQARHGLRLPYSNEHALVESINDKIKIKIKRIGFADVNSRISELTGELTPEIDISTGSIRMPRWAIHKRDFLTGFLAHENGHVAISPIIPGLGAYYVVLAYSILKDKFTPEELNLPSKGDLDYEYYKLARSIANFTTDIILEMGEYIFGLKDIKEIYKANLTIIGSDGIRFSYLPNIVKALIEGIMYYCDSEVGSLNCGQQKMNEVIGKVYLDMFSMGVLASLPQFFEKVKEEAVNIMKYVREAFEAVGNNPRIFREVMWKPLREYLLLASNPSGDTVVSPSKLLEHAHTLEHFNEAAEKIMMSIIRLHVETYKQLEQLKESLRNSPGQQSSQAMPGGGGTVNAPVNTQHIGSRGQTGSTSNSRGGENESTSSQGSTQEQGENRGDTSQGRGTGRESSTGEAQSGEWKQQEGDSSSRDSEDSASRSGSRDASGSTGSTSKGSGSNNEEGKPDSNSTGQSRENPSGFGEQGGSSSSGESTSTQDSMGQGEGSRRGGQTASTSSQGGQSGSGSLTPNVSRQGRQTGSVGLGGVKSKSTPNQGPGLTGQTSKTSTGSSEGGYTGKNANGYPVNSGVSGSSNASTSLGRGQETGNSTPTSKQGGRSEGGNNTGRPGESESERGQPEKNTSRRNTGKDTVNPGREGEGEGRTQGKDEKDRSTRERMERDAEGGTSKTGRNTGEDRKDEGLKKEYSNSAQRGQDKGKSGAASGKGIRGMSKEEIKQKIINDLKKAIEGGKGFVHPLNPDMYISYMSPEDVYLLLTLSRNKSFRVYKRAIEVLTKIYVKQVSEYFNKILKKITGEVNMLIAMKKRKSYEEKPARLPLWVAPHGDIDEESLLIEKRKVKWDVWVKNPNDRIRSERRLIVPKRVVVVVDESGSTTSIYSEDVSVPIHLVERILAMYVTAALKAVGGGRKIRPIKFSTDVEVTPRDLPTSRGLTVLLIPMSNPYQSTNIVGATKEAIRLARRNDAIILITDAEIDVGIAREVAGMIKKALSTGRVGFVTIAVVNNEKTDGFKVLREELAKVPTAIVEILMPSEGMKGLVGFIKKVVDRVATVYGENK